MKCALPECFEEFKPVGRKRFCSTSHKECARQRRNRAINDGAKLAPNEVPALLNNPHDHHSGKASIGTIADMLYRNGIGADDIGKVQTIRFSEWDAAVKGGDVERRTSASIVLHPSWDTGPEWPLVQPAAPVNVRVPTAKAKKAGWKTCLLLPDPQFGFRRDIYDGGLEPFHDVRALDIALQIAEIVRPDLTIWLGDVLDFAPASNKYQQEPGFALTMQPTVDTAYEWIAKFAALSDETRYIEGNHDVRLQNMIIDDAKVAFGMKRAAATPDEWPVLSIPNLLRFDELGVEYVGGYPAGATYINDNVAAIHGVKIGNNTRSSASMVVEDERVSVITGHVHRIETRYKTRNVRAGRKTSFAHTPGCLCRIDGAVPSVKSGLDVFGRAVKSYEDWQQGVALVRYEEGDGRYDLEHTAIFDGWAMFGERLIEARDG